MKSLSEKSKFSYAFNSLIRLLISGAKGGPKCSTVGGTQWLRYATVDMHENTSVIKHLVKDLIFFWPQNQMSKTNTKIQSQEKEIQSLRNMIKNLETQIQGKNKTTLCL